MINRLIQLLVVILVAVIVWWIAGLLIAAFGLPAIAGTIVGAILGLVVILYALKVFGLWSGDI